MQRSAQVASTKEIKGESPSRETRRCGESLPVSGELIDKEDLILDDS